LDDHRANNRGDIRVWSNLAIKIDNEHDEGGEIVLNVEENGPV
jgi:hypothetical protein